VWLTSSIDKKRQDCVNCGGEEYRRDDYEKVLDYEECYAVGIEFGGETAEDIADDLLQFYQ
jgi:hypothetical protein